jgi:hypothetical protein
MSHIYTQLEPDKSLLSRSCSTMQLITFTKVYSSTLMLGNLESCDDHAPSLKSDWQHPTCILVKVGMLGVQIKLFFLEIEINFKKCPACPKASCLWRLRDCVHEIYISASSSWENLTSTSQFTPSHKGFIVGSCTLLLQKCSPQMLTLSRRPAQALLACSLQAWAPKTSCSIPFSNGLNIHLTAAQ